MPGTSQPIIGTIGRWPIGGRGGRKSFPECSTYSTYRAVCINDAEGARTLIYLWLLPSHKYRMRNDFELTPRTTNVSQALMWTPVSSQRVVKEVTDRVAMSPVALGSRSPSRPLHRVPLWSALRSVCGLFVFFVSRVFVGIVVALTMKVYRQHELLALFT